MQSDIIPVDSPSVIAEVAAGEGITLSQAARLMSPSGSRRPLHPATIWRWSRDGVKLADGTRARLEVCRLGCRWLTSRAAVARFLVAQNQPVTANQTAEVARTHNRNRNRQAPPGIEADLERLRL